MLIGGRAREAKEEKKKRKIHFPWGYCFAIAIVVLIFCAAIIQFDNENERNTRSVTGIITNAEYDDDRAKELFFLPHNNGKTDRECMNRK